MAKKSSPSTIVWFRQDLRLGDNPAFYNAVAKGNPIVPLYIWVPEEEGVWPPGGASCVWLHHALTKLEHKLSQRNCRLIIRKGGSLSQLQEVLNESNANAIYWNRRYEPYALERDKKVKSYFQNLGLDVRSFNASLLYEPWEIKNQSGHCYKVFTPYYKALNTMPSPDIPLNCLQRIPAPKQWPDSLSIEQLGLLAKITWYEGILEHWTPGEDGAYQRFLDYCKQGVEAYDEERNFPARANTSRLSPHLHFGEISPRHIWHTLHQQLKKSNNNTFRTNVMSFLRELIWREFSYHLLYHFPETTENPLRSEFENFPWRNDPAALKAWQQGKTGYPLVDAGMRELWHTGWMHNRVRMVAASFLVKHLLIHWHEGARWFWDTLVDADLANNTMGWQWTAGCGADAAPYFRIFNPITQSEKFDSSGEYIRRWVPEIAQLPNKWIHKPWLAPQHILTEADIKIGSNYPFPIVDHSVARQRALDAYEVIKKKSRK